MSDNGCKTESRLERVLQSGNFAVTAEVGPPKSASSKGISRHAAAIKEVADAINLTDNQTAIVRLCSLAAAVHVLKAGGEPVMQMTCRDRNRIAMQSDLLGAWSLGVRNVLCLSGDHVSFGNHPQARMVYDLDSVQLIKLVHDMRESKRFLNGEEIKVAPPRFFVGAAENPFADPTEFRALRLAKKVKAGADFIQTQAVFDLEKFTRWMQVVRDMGLPEKVHILAGIVPTKSAKALEKTATVPGMAVPQELIVRMKGAADQEKEGVAIAVELISRLREIPGVHGVHIMAIAWEEAVPDIVSQAGLLPRPAPEVPAAATL
ncbi:MAG TPA: methylenetetrahydrofolate reductase [Firmicutes bacterium]|nr:methylenetetrahydrofolate reductase [Bacillota bacterium]